MEKLIAQIETKKKTLEVYQPLPYELAKNLEEWLKVELTYTSNAIEGNTLSRIETALVIEKGLTVEGKTLVEHLEAVNHAQALGFVKNLVKKKRQKINQEDILALHKIILQKIDDLNAGKYRDIPVRVAGSRVVFPNPQKVPQLMRELINWLLGALEHPLKIAADLHFKLVSIHPFTDGNGRTARLLMNLILLQNGYPAAIIRKEDRKRYLEAIEKGQLTGNLDDYYRIIYQAADRSLDIYLEAVR